MPQTKTFRVPATLTFTGYFLVDAESPEEARRIADQDCGAILGPAHTTQPDNTVDWFLPTHPEKTLGTPVEDAGE